MKNDILNLFSEYLEKQDILCRLTESKKLNGYGYSEIHVIRAIQTLESPNVTEIAHALKMTRGAITKITKRLMEKGLIMSYSRLGNKQKVFFKLTDEGLILYAEHEKRHNLWLERDKRFLARFSDGQIAQITEFMREYNKYLNTQIEELGAAK